MTEQHSPHHQQQHPQQQQGLQQVPPVSTGSGKQAHGLGALGRMAGKVAKGSFQVVANGAKAATHAASNVANVAGSGLGAISSSGQGFRDFILRSNVVDLAVAVVIGMAFTSLIEAFTKDFITPAMGAVFAGEGRGRGAATALVQLQRQCKQQANSRSSKVYRTTSHTCCWFVGRCSQQAGLASIGW